MTSSMHTQPFSTMACAPLCARMQVALNAVKDAIGAVSYVEFVLHPAPMFESFVTVADRILDAIPNAGGAQASEPQQQVSTQHSTPTYTDYDAYQQLGKY